MDKPRHPAQNARMTDSVSITRRPRRSFLLDRAIPPILILAAVVVSIMRIEPDQRNGIGQSLSILSSIFLGILEFGLMVAAVNAHSHAFPGVLGTPAIALPRMGAIAIAAGSVGAFIIASHNYNLPNDLMGLAIAIAVMLMLYILLIRILFSISGTKLLFATAFLAVFEFASLIAICGVIGMK